MTWRIFQDSREIPVPNNKPLVKITGIRGGGVRLSKYNKWKVSGFFSWLFYKRICKLRIFPTLRPWIFFSGLDWAEVLLGGLTSKQHIPSSSGSLYIWNQGSSYLIYWQLGALFQVHWELEDQGFGRFLLNKILTSTATSQTVSTVGQHFQRVRDVLKPFLKATFDAVVMNPHLRHFFAQKTQTLYRPFSGTTSFFLWVFLGVFLTPLLLCFICLLKLVFVLFQPPNSFNPAVCSTDFLFLVNVGRCILRKIPQIQHPGWWDAGEDAEVRYVANQRSYQATPRLSSNA